MSILMIIEGLLSIEHRNLLGVCWNVLRRNQLDFYMCVDATNPGMSSFRRVIVPNDITLKFLQVAQRNTGMP